MTLGMTPMLLPLAVMATVATSTSSPKALTKETKFPAPKQSDFVPRKTSGDLSFGIGPAAVLYLGGGQKLGSATALGALGYAALKVTSFYEDETEIYCENRLFGQKYAQEKADTYATQRTQAATKSKNPSKKQVQAETGWRLGVPGSCWRAPSIQFFVGGVLPHAVNFTQGDMASQKVDAKIGLATGATVRMFGIDLLTGPTLMWVEELHSEQEVTIKRMKLHLAWIVGIGASLDLGKMLVGK